MRLDALEICKHFQKLSRSLYLSRTPNGSYTDLQGWRWRSSMTFVCQLILRPLANVLFRARWSEDIHQIVNDTLCLAIYQSWHQKVTSHVSAVSKIWWLAPLLRSAYARRNHRMVRIDFQKDTCTVTFAWTNSRVGSWRFLLESRNLDRRPMISSLSIICIDWI